MYQSLSELKKHPKWHETPQKDSIVILALKLLFGALRGRISPCCFLTGQPLAGTIKKEKKQETSQEERAGKEEKLFPSVTCEPQVKKHSAKC